MSCARTVLGTMVITSYMIMMILSLSLSNDRQVQMIILHCSFAPGLVEISS